MFVTETLPQLVIATVKPITPPGIPFVAGQSLATVKQGVICTGQVLVALAVTKPSPVAGQRLVAVAVRMSVIEQTLVGTGMLPKKVTHAPLVRKAILVTTKPPVARS